MGIGDSIGKAAENAMEDLAGTSRPTEKTHVPDPANPKDDVEVHSSLSEGSNAMEAEKQKAPGLKTGAAPAPVSDSPLGGDVDDTDNDAAHSDTPDSDTPSSDSTDGGNTDDGGLAGDATAPTETDQR